METDRVLSVAAEPRCTAVEIVGKESPARLLAILDEGEAALPWTWLEITRDGGSCRVRAVRPDPAPDEGAMHQRARGSSAIVHCCRDLAVVSLVGEGILARTDLLSDAVGALGGAGIEVRSSRTASLAVSFLIESSQVEDAVRLLHGRFVEPRVS